jgi:hypothetical protein
MVSPRGLPPLLSNSTIKDLGQPAAAGFEEAGLGGAALCGANFITILLTR